MGAIRFGIFCNELPLIQSCPYKVGPMNSLVHQVVLGWFWFFGLLICPSGLNKCVFTSPNKSQAMWYPTNISAYKWTFTYSIFCLRYTVLWLLIKLWLTDRCVFLSFNPVSCTNSPKALFILRRWNVDSWVLRK